MKIKILNNISTKETFCLIAMVLCFIIALVVPISATSMYNSSISEFIKEQKKEIYLWDKESVKKAKLAENFDDPEDGSIKAHLGLFHKLFWSAEPYMEYIEQNHEEALKMGDKSIVILKRFLEKESYFQTNIAGGYSILVKIEPKNIEIDYTEKPYRFTLNGELKVLRNNDIVIKKLITTGRIRSKGESDNKFDDWYILDYNVQEFKDIRVLKHNEL